MQTQNKTIETIFFMAIAVEQEANDSGFAINLKWAIEQEFKKWPRKELLTAMDKYLAQNKCPHYKEVICKYLPETTSINLEDAIDLSRNDVILKALASAERVNATIKQDFINEIRQYVMKSTSCLIRN